MSENTQNNTQTTNRVPRPRVQTHTTPNGQEIPVVVRPMSNGESVNNVDVIDMSPTYGETNMNMEEFTRMMKLHNERVNANKVVLSAEISAREIIKGKEKVDKASNLPILDSHGFPVTYPDRYKVTLTFKGGTLVQNVSEAMYNDLELNATYMFKGSLGFVKDFGNDVLSPIWQSWERVI